ncbi:helix-turn-helix domain-containing protein [Paenibacillus sp. CN-4]|uniref:helix-turn-helix domain-containing protein n=1 Tax=Paenibacillus nanchangensis TaxID=3348343 RepID=UPI0039793CD3
MTPFENQEAMSKWVEENILFTSEAMEVMNCTRQNLHHFVQKGRLVPIKTVGRERLFLRSDVLKLQESVSSYNRKPKDDQPSE